MRGKAALDEGTLLRVIDEAITIKSLEPRFHLAGGESFLDVDQCLRLFARARAAGYARVSTTTNAYWAASPTSAWRVAKACAAAGLTNVELSWDVWHAPYVQAAIVENAIHAFFFCGVQVNLRILGTKSHSYWEALNHFSDTALGRVEQITAGPVHPTGRASMEIDVSDLHFTDEDVAGTCHRMLNLTVVSDGTLFPCCSGLDQTPVAFGNVKERGIVQAYYSMMSDPLIRLLVFGGPKFVWELVRELRGDAKSSRYANICHACWDLFSDSENVEPLRQHLSKIPELALLNVLTTAAAE